MKKFLCPAFALAAAMLIGRSALALTLTPPTAETAAKPGETVQIVAKLFNETSESMDLRPGAMSFAAKNEQGQPEFFDDKTGLDLQHWLSFPQEVTLAPQERKSVVITIAVPKGADPGGHYAAISWGTQPPKTENSGAGIQGQIAMLILVNVEGDIKEDLGTIEFHPVSAFLTHLPVDFEVRVRNDGSIHEHPSGDIVIRNMFGRQSAVLPFNIQPSTGNVLPKSVRRFDASWVKRNLDAGKSEWSKEWHNFALGRYTAELVAAYGPSNKLMTARTSFWVFPWMVSTAALIAAAIAFLALRTLVRAYNRHIIRKYGQGKFKK